MATTGNRVCLLDPCITKNIAATHRRYVYDFPIPQGADPVLFTPKPLDGEVESFELLSVDQVMTKMREKLFKPNCALVLIDFFIRHSYITPDSEPDYMEIITRLHGRFDHDNW